MKTAIKQVTDKLRKFRARKKQVQFLEDVLYTAQFGLIAFAILPLFFIYFLDDSIYRWLISSVFLGFGLYLTGRYILPHLQKIFFQKNTPHIDAVAFEVGHHIPGIKDALSNAIQLKNQYKDDRENPFVEHAFRQVLSQIGDKNFLDLISWRTVSKRARRAGVVAALCVLSMFIFNQNYQSALSYALNPMKKIEQDRFAIEVKPGGAEIVRGENLDISVRIDGVLNAEPHLIFIQPNGATNKIALQRTNVGTFGYECLNVQESFSYRVVLQKQQTQTFEVSVIQLPEVQEFQLTVTPPAYTKLPNDTLEENIGDASVYPGSEIHFAITPNKEIKSASIEFGDGSQLPLKLEGAIYQSAQTVKKATDYKIRLSDPLDLLNPAPIQYKISLLEDRIPEVAIVKPGQDMELDESMEIPLGIEGSDDFGFRSLNLVYRTIKAKGDTSAEQRVPLKFSTNGRLLAASHYWDLTSIQIFPEDMVAYYVELFDNDVINGPKHGVSQTYRLLLPSMEELFSQASESQSESESAIEDIYNESKDVQETYEKVLQNLRTQPEMKWQDEQALKEAMQKQETIAEKINDVKKQLEQMVDKLEKNDLLALETLQKYQELQELLEKVATPEMREMMKKLEEAMKNMDTKEMTKALEEMQFSQEEFVKNMDKTINMLKQLEAERKLDEAIRTAEEMLKKQSEINEQAQDLSDRQKADQAAEEQQNQQARKEQLDKAMEDLQKAAEELPQMQMPQEGLQEAMQNSRELSEQMQQNVSQLQKQQSQQSQQTGQQISSSLEKMHSSLTQTQQQMQQNQKSEVMQALRKNRRNIMRLSKRQEQLSQQTSQQDASQYRDLAREQEELYSALQRTAGEMFNLSEKSFHIPPEVSRKLGESMQNMREAISGLEGVQGLEAARQQDAAVQSLNGTMRELRNAMQQLSQQGGSMLEQFLQQMQQMTQQQQGINQGTQQLGMQGQLSPSQQQSMQQLAAQQEALRQALEQLQGSQAGGEALGDLQHIAEEMKEAAKEMQTKEVDPRLIERQQRILTRMLDAQKSVRKQDFSKKRESRTGETYVAEDPGELEYLLREREQKRQRDLLRAEKGKYAKDYQELIDRYFEALLKNENQN